jgi:hypothetical protein
MVILIIGDIDIVLPEVFFPFFPEFLAPNLNKSPLVLVLAFNYLLPCKLMDPVG